MTRVWQVTEPTLVLSQVVGALKWREALCHGKLLAPHNSAQEPLVIEPQRESARTHMSLAIGFMVGGAVCDDAGLWGF